MSIFNTEESNVTNTTVTTEDSSVSSPASTESFVDLLGTVVNDKGEQKYSSVPEAMKGLVHSQAYIKDLEAELAQKRQELEQRNTVDEALEKLTQTQEPQATPAVGLDEEAVGALLEQRLQQREQAQAVETNTKKVVDAIQTKFGDKAEEVFYGKATELGMTKEQFNQLAAQSPSAVLAFFNTQVPKTSVSQSSINTAAFTPTNDEVPTFRENGVERIRLNAPEKSILMGATNQDLMAEARRHKDAVFKKYGITL